MTNDNNSITCWVSGPTIIMKGPHQPQQVMVYDVPVGAHFWTWRKVEGSWTVHGSHLLSVQYVEANSKREIHQKFQDEESGSGSVEATSKVIVANVLECNTVERQRRQI